MASKGIAVIGGVDTHTDFHQAAVIDTVGRHLATKAFPTTPDGYQHLLDWLLSHGDLLAVGLEGTGAYGGGIARFLTTHDITIVEVDRPDRKARRHKARVVRGPRSASASVIFSVRRWWRRASRRSATQVAWWGSGRSPASRDGPGCRSVRRRSGFAGSRAGRPGR